MIARSSSLTSAGRRLKSARPPTTDIAVILAAPGPRARPKHAVPPGSFAELSCQKIVFDLQLTNLAVQKIDLRLADRSLCRRAAALENAHRPIEQLLLPVVDLVRMNPERARQLGDCSIASDRRQRHLRLECRVVLLPCLLHVLLPRHRRLLGAGLHLSQLSRFRGPSQPFFGPSNLLRSVELAHVSISRRRVPEC